VITAGTRVIFPLGWENSFSPCSNQISSYISSSFLPIPPPLLQPIQSISLAEERTVDGRDVGFAEGRGRAGWAGSPEASVEWLQQIRGLQQNNMGGMGMGEQHGRNYLRIQGSEGRMPGGLSELILPLCYCF